MTVSEKKQENASKGPFYPMSTKIELDKGKNDFITTQNGEYNINPNLDSEYEIMIGIKCDATIPEGTTSLSLSFKSKTAQFLSSYEFNIN